LDRHRAVALAYESQWRLLHFFAAGRVHI